MNKHLFTALVFTTLAAYAQASSIPTGIPAKQGHPMAKKRTSPTPKPAANSGTVTLDTGYNNEQVQLPAYYWKQVEALHAQLKAKLPPSDYGEILKGEQNLFNEDINYSINNNWHRFSDDGDITGNIRQNPQPVIKKLESILQDPSDANFPRTRIVEEKHDGVFMIETVETSGVMVEDGDKDFILSSTPGLTIGDSTLFTFWDTRTLKKSLIFAHPGYTNVKRDKSGLYIIVAPPTEYTGSLWYYNGGVDREPVCIVDPVGKAYQSLHGSIYSLKNIIPKAGLKKGDLLSRLPASTITGLSSETVSVDRAEKLANLAVTGATHLGLWAADMPWMSGRRMHATSPSPASTGLTFYKRKRYSHDVTQKGFHIDFDTLTTHQETGGQRYPSSSDKSAPKHLFPALEGGMDYVRGKEEGGWIPFSLVGGDGATPEHSTVFGLDDGKQIFLLPSSRTENILAPDPNVKDGEFPFRLSGKLYPYIRSRDERKLSFPLLDYDNLESDEYTPYRSASVSCNDLMLLVPISGTEMELIMGGNLQEGLDGAARMRVDLAQKRYGKIQAWKFPSQALDPAWLPSREWFFKPESSHRYSIIHAPASGTESKLADLYLLGKNAYAIVLANGHYAGSPGCERFLGFAKDGMEIGMDALAPWRNRPAEVLEALGGNADDIAALRETTRRWLRKSGYDMDAMPPEPAIGSFPQVDVKLPELHQHADNMDIEVTVQAKEAAVKQLSVRADGNNIPLYQNISVPPGTSKAITVPIPLATGQNWIELAATDENGLTSDVFRFRVIQDGRRDSELYVVAIGVSEYEDADLKLQYAAKDAKDVAAAFQRIPGKTHVLTLTDSDFKDASALEKISAFLAGSSINDRVVMYCAGHGVLDGQLNYYYAPAAFNPEDIPGTGIPMDSLTRCLTTAPARKKLLLLDTCHAGSVGEEDEQKLAAAGVALPKGVRAISQRGMKVKQAQKALTGAQTKRFIEEMFANDASTRGLNIISASAGSEYALESDQWKNGVFASATVKAVTCGIPEEDDSLFDRFYSCTPTGDDAPGKLTVEALMGFVSSEVSKMTNGAQIPKMNSSEGAAYFILADNLAPAPQPAVPEPEQPATEPTAPSAPIHVEYGTPLGGSEAAKLDNLMDRVRSMYCAAPDQQLHQQGLLTLLQEIRKGANINLPHPENKGNTALYYACALEEYTLVKWLLEHGADPNTANNEGATPIQTLRSGNPAIANLLRDYGADSAPSGAPSYTPPPTPARRPGAYDERASLDPLIANMRALRCKQADSKLYQKRLLTLLPLIRNGADVDITLPETKGNTALHYACGIGSLSITRWLLEHGANPNAVTNKGATPLMCTGSDNGNAIRALLRQYGATH